MTNQTATPKQEAHEWAIPSSVLVVMSWDQRRKPTDNSPLEIGMAEALNSGKHVKMGYGSRYVFPATIEVARYILTDLHGYLSMLMNSEGCDPDQDSIDKPRLKAAISTLTKQIAKVEASHE